MRTLLCTCQYRPAPCRPTNSLYCSDLFYSGLKCIELKYYLRNTLSLPGQPFKGPVSIVCNHVNRARICKHTFIAPYRCLFLTCKREKYTVLIQYIVWMCGPSNCKNPYLEWWPFEQGCELPSTPIPSCKSNCGVSSGCWPPPHSLTTLDSTSLIAHTYASQFFKQTEDDIGTSEFFLVRYITTAALRF